MTKNELNDAYFNWMCQLVFDGRYSKKLSYRRLLKVLHKIEFTYSIPMDGNRAEDGIDLRYRFGYENGCSSSMISAYLDNKTCSVLEMMIDIKVLHMWDAESGMIDSWHKYCQKQMRDSFHTLDDKLIFSNTKTDKKDYASKKLKYPLEAGDLSAYNKLMSTLYSETERQKIEWAIGSIVCGESKKLQKFMVLYGAAGTGKSTVLNIIQQLFEGCHIIIS